MNEVIVISKFAQLTKRAEGATVQAGGKVIKGEILSVLESRSKNVGFNSFFR